MRNVTIQKFVGLNPKLYSFLVDDRSEHKKSNGGNKNLVTRISYSEYEVFLNNKCLSLLMNKIQSKTHKIGTYRINKVLLSY